MTEANSRLESALEAGIARATARPCPPTLAAAVRYAVFPGGHRIRPRLTLAVAAANGDANPALANAAACAVEFLHCASLIHDDLPCFDDASLRRGKPSVHLVFGERLAVLSGDALIVAAFETLGAAFSRGGNAAMLPSLLSVIGRGVGMPGGIVAGQAWECEPQVNMTAYHRAKTGALFVASTGAGAAAAGVDPAPWSALGELIGESYQVADDIRDVAEDPESIGKPVGRDEALDRPNAVRELGLDGAIARLKSLVSEGIESIPLCPGRAWLRDVIVDEAKRFLPARLARRAA